MEDPSDVLLTDDQYFLLYLIMGTYFGPDLKERGPPKSALQRHAEMLPQYTANDLTGSQIRTTVLESVYYYVLRKAEQEVVVKQPLLLQYIHGGLPLSVRSSSNYPQFDDLFPPYLHFHFQYGNHDDAIDNIVFLNNPPTDCIKPGDIGRFKRLTGLENFTLDRESAIQYTFMSNGVLNKYKGEENSRLDEPKPDINSVSCSETHPDGNGLPNCTLPCTSSPCNAEPVSCSYTTTSQINTSSGDNSDSGMMFVPACPSKEEWSNLVGTIKGGFALTGSAARAQIGPVLGLIDIGESEDSYIFRVALPGVRRDERDFSCEVENDGAVIIRGVTETGERTVWKYSQAFEMQTQNLCPPGPFSISFMLPGPVDPQQFHGTFASDGILEGIALKAKRSPT